MLNSDTMTFSKVKPSKARIKSKTTIIVNIYLIHYLAYTKQKVHNFYKCKQAFSKVLEEGINTWSTLHQLRNLRMFTKFAYKNKTSQTTEALPTFFICTVTIYSDAEQSREIRMKQTCVEKQ